jgi:hypothetical protein
VGSSNGEKMQTPKLKAGTSLDIVFENEIMKSNAHYLKAVVYDFENDLITISQTTPALNRNFLDRRILVTFLANIERRLLRFGFPARLIDLIATYQIASGNDVEALQIKKYADPAPVDFRMYFRVRLPSQSDLSLFYKEEKVNLMDISIGGAKFIYPKKYIFRPADVVKCTLIIGSTIFNVNAKVRTVRIPSEAAANKNLQYVSVEFNHDNKQMDALLGKAILDIERGLLSEGKI